MSTYAFQFVAGRLCLDFINTLGDRGRDPPSEHLPQYGELLRWAAEAGVIGADTSAAILREAERRPTAARQVLRRARQLREALYAIVSAGLRGDEPAESDVETLNRELGRALSHTRIRALNGEFEMGWSDTPPDLDRPLWPVARSAAELLASDARERIKACAADSCQWLFVDESRNRSRQWCQMEVCGNRAKARRHYARARSRRRSRNTPDANTEPMHSEQRTHRGEEPT